MNNHLVLLFLFIAIIIIPAFVRQAREKLYQNNRFSIRYPRNWECTADNDIVHIFPTGNYGFLAITTYTGLEVPLSDTPALLREILGIGNNQLHILITTKEDSTEYYLQHTQGNMVYTAKAFRKENDCVVVAVQCEAGKWETEKNLFLQTLRSFTLA